MTATIESIHISPNKGLAMRAVDRCMAETGKGLSADRYAIGTGIYSNWPSDHQLTLIEGEFVDHLNSIGFSIRPGECRRNLTTRGIALNALVGKQFHVGTVLCQATRLCDPCGYLERLLAFPGLARAMKDRGGLRATILTGGTINVGDRIEVSTY